LGCQRAEIRFVSAPTTPWSAAKSPASSHSGGTNGGEFGANGGVPSQSQVSCSSVSIASAPSWLGV
jgi:hypothetical protein